MNKEDFIDVSKRMVKEYLSRYLGEEINIDDVQLIKFHDEPSIYKTLLIAPYSDEIYYEVVYDKDSEQLRSYIYKNDGFRVVGKKL